MTQVGSELEEIEKLEKSSHNLIEFALPPVLGVPFVEWYRQLYEIGYRLWEVNYRRTAAPRTIDQDKAIALLRSAKTAKEALGRAVAAKCGPAATPGPTGRTSARPWRPRRARWRGSEASAPRMSAFDCGMPKCR